MNIPLDAVLHPASSFAQQSANDQQAAAGRAPSVQRTELKVQEWLEQAAKAERAKDDVQAVNWYRKAAEAGDTRGMVNLGLDVQ